MTDIPAEVLELHRLHVEEGMTCKEISILYGHDPTWTPRIFRRYKLPYRNKYNSRMFTNANGNGKEPETKLPDKLRVRLAIRDGQYIAFAIDENGKRIGRGVPASPYEIALWQECKRYILAT